MSIAAVLAPAPRTVTQDALMLLLLAAAGQQGEGEGEEEDTLKPTTMEYVSDGDETGPATGGGHAGAEGGDGGHPPHGLDERGDFNDNQPRKGLPMGAKIAIGGVSALGVIAVLGASWIYMRVRNRVHNYSSMQQVAQQPAAQQPKNPVHQHVNKALSQNKPVRLSTAPALADHPPSAQVNGSSTGQAPSTVATGPAHGLSVPPLGLSKSSATSHATHKAGKATSNQPSLSTPALALSKSSKAGEPVPAPAKATKTNSGAHALASQASEHAHASKRGLATAKPASFTTQPAIATASAQAKHSTSTPATRVITSLAPTRTKNKPGTATTVAAVASPSVADTKPKPADAPVAPAHTGSGGEKNQRVNPKMASELQHLQHSLKHLQTQMVSLKQAQSAAHHAVAKAKQQQGHEKASAKTKAELVKLKKREAKLVAENKHLKGAVHWLSEVEARLKKKLHSKAAYPGWCVIGTGLNSAVLSGPEHKTKLVHVGTKIFGAKVTKIDPSHNEVMTTDGVFSCQN